jgi:hypothetical protein
MGTMVVVVLEILEEESAELAFVPDQRVVQQLSSDGSHEPLCDGVRSGAPGGVWITSMPSVVKMLSKPVTNTVALSRIRNRTRSRSTAMDRLRAAWVHHLPLRDRVRPPM